MMEANPAHCEDCSFFKAPMTRPDCRVGYGECRRYPPVIDGKGRELPDMRSSSRLGTFPLVESLWGCGEFRAQGAR